jgi:hypothetical protein
LEALRVKPCILTTVRTSGTLTIEHPTLHADIGEVIDNTIDRIRLVHWLVLLEFAKIVAHSSMGFIHMADTLGNSHRNYGHARIILLGMVLELVQSHHVRCHNNSTRHTESTILSRTVGYIVNDGLLTNVVDERVLLFSQDFVLSFSHSYYLL